MIQFKELKIKNFMSLGEAEVDLSTGGFTLVSAINNRVEDQAGSNGSGKSSISEAIVWCLTGETIRGHKEVINRYTEGSCEVEISFDFKGHNWAIKRCMAQTKEKSLVMVKDGLELATKGYRDAQEVFLRELPEITFKFLNSVIIMGQGLPGRFTNNSPAGRKAVLEELTNADFMITQIKENIKRRQEKLSSELRIFEDKKLSEETRFSMNNRELSKLVLILDELNKKDLSRLEERKASLLSQISTLDSQRELLSGELSSHRVILEEAKKLLNEKTLELGKHISDLKVKLANDRSEISLAVSKETDEKILVLNDRLLKGERLISESKEKISHNKALLSGGICKLCGQKLSSVSDETLDEAKRVIEVEMLNLKKYQDLYNLLLQQKKDIQATAKEKEKELFNKKTLEFSKLENEVSDKYNLEISELKDDLVAKEKLLDKCSSDLDSVNRLLMEIKVELSKVESEVNGHFEKISESQSQINSLELQIKESTSLMDEFITKVDDIKNRLSIVKQMETFASRDFRGILLEGVIDRMNTIIGNYAETVYGNRLTNFYLDGNAIQVEFDGKEYESLSGGEQQKINVILQLSLRDLIVELTGITGSILFLDEIFDGLDRVGCEKMIELFQAIDSSIFIITHHSDSLNIPYDYSLTVIKESNGVAHIQKGV